ncbi:hypothetical protein JYU34_014223 [Plutella xylostella]|uniref:Carboxylesterase type B domain-containing protein n=1 Tax=Plutella xylostella TaxID=51655 RepID=A0ABQ7Q999_PLUXY|nr:hypothetical protein JYU34_014223 [Plutella xylostella]
MRCSLTSSIVMMLSAIVSQILAQPGPLVHIAQGSLVGDRALDGDYNVFYGIPYAGSVAGRNRFKAPPPATRFQTDPFDATDSLTRCAQPTTRGLEGQEDCLVLNIFSQNMSASQPVLVFIDGEEYTTMRNNLYTFKYLVENKILVVSINYRLSIFGFLCLGVEQAPGNAGLKDIIAGLQWINKNIASFGGDPNNVVLFGHGSGAAMVDLLTLSPLSENLVHKAIASSGTSFAPWAVAYKPVEYAELVGEKLQYTKKSRAELAQALAETNLDTLGAALTGFNFLNNTPLFAPCIEDNTLKPDSAFLSDAPINIIRSGKYRHVPFITGYANRDGTLRATEGLIGNWLQQMNYDFANALPVDIKHSRETVESIRDVYFKGAINSASIEDYFDFEGDTMFLISTIRAAVERSKTSRGEVRLYEFSFRGHLSSDWAFPGVDVTGAEHRSVLRYLFDYDIQSESIDKTIQESLVRRWTAFAYTGKPTSYMDQNSTGDDIWGAVSKNSVTTAGAQAIEYMRFQGHINEAVYEEKKNINPHNDRRLFWDSVYEGHYAAPKPVSDGSNGLCVMTPLVLLCFIIVLL